VELAAVCALQGGPPENGTYNGLYIAQKNLAIGFPPALSQSEPALEQTDYATGVLGLLLATGRVTEQDEPERAGRQEKILTRPAGKESEEGGELGLGASDALQRGKDRTTYHPGGSGKRGPAHSLLCHLAEHQLHVLHERRQAAYSKLPEGQEKEALRLNQPLLHVRFQPSHIVGGRN